MSERVLPTRVRVLIYEPGAGKWRDVTWFECARQCTRPRHVFSAIKARRNIARHRDLYGRKWLVSRPDRRMQLFVCRIFCSTSSNINLLKCFLLCNVCLWYKHGNISRNVTVSKFKLNPPTETHNMSVSFLHLSLFAMNLDLFISVPSLYFYRPIY